MQLCCQQEVNTSIVSDTKHVIVMQLLSLSTSNKRRFSKYLRLIAFPKYIEYKLRIKCQSSQRLVIKRKINICMAKQHSLLYTTHNNNCCCLCLLLHTTMCTLHLFTVPYNMTLQIWYRYYKFFLRNPFLRVALPAFNYVTSYIHTQDMYSSIITYMASPSDTCIIALILKNTVS